MSSEASHRQALLDLEQGRPRQALGLWRQLLQRERPAVQAHLEAAAAALAADPLAPLRRQALTLLHGLLHGEPGEAEVAALGALLRDWGALCRSEAPGRALQHSERAWSCGPDPRLARQLAGLYRRMGFVTGAALLAPEPQQEPQQEPTGPTDPEPWPALSCLAQACASCQDKPAPADRDLQLWSLPQGRCWLQRHTNPWGHSHGVAVQDAQGRYVAPLCRRYPWPWPACPHHDALEAEALCQLAWLEATPAAGLPAAVPHSGPVLAVAELSGELYYHWMLELLPRLGRCWPQLLAQWPDLRLWHNGGSPPWVAESLARLGIGPERLIGAHQVPHLQAELLLVPGFASGFGQPAQASLAWLEAFWAVPPAAALAAHASAAPDPAGPPLLLPRPLGPRRPVLGLPGTGLAHLPQGPVTGQLQAVAGAGRLVAPHGAAMANLLAAPAGATLLELANPAYRPPYFAPLVARRGLRHRVLDAAPTPWPLQELLYEGPLAFPIDLRPGCSPAAEALAAWLDTP